MKTKKAGMLGILFLAVLAVLAPCASAQESAAKGSLNGTVVDSTGGTIVGASVTLSGPFGDVNQVTNGSGVFIFQDLVPGTYKIRIEMKGFKTSQVAGVTINVGSVTAIRVPLEPGSISTTVEVVGTAVTVDTTSTAVATNIDDEFFNKLPLQRGVAGLFYLAPGVVSGGGTGSSNPSIGGATGLENLYIADGVSITDTAFGGLGLYSRVYGSVGTGINLTFIKEVQIKTGSIQPQYGGATGGVVQIVTKSGGTSYHGAIAGYAQPNQFEAKRLNVDDFDLANPFGSVLHQANFDVSGEVGGPVPGLKDKLFFFGSFDPSRVDTLAMSPPLDGNAAFGALGGRQLSLNYAAKLTFKLNDKNTLEGSVFGDPTSSNSFPWSRLTMGVNGIPNTTNFSKLNFGNRDVVARYNGTLSPSWILNMDVTWQHNKFTETGYDNADSRIVDETQTLVGAAGGSGIPAGVQQGQFTSVGRGFVENTRDESYGVHINTTKIVNFWGQHTFDIGYGYSRPYYDGERTNSGPALTAPVLNQDGALAGFGFQCTGTGASTHCPWSGTTANYLWTLNNLQNTDPNGANYCPTGGGGTRPVCALMNVPGLGPNGTSAFVPVALEEFRSEFGVSADGFKHFDTTGRVHSAYVNDNWTINKYVTLNAGLRWQQERLIGENTQYTFTDNWSPSLGVTVDPLGDRKNKFWFSFGRYNYNLPLDLAERSLTNELDLFSVALVPAFTVNANGDRVATINSFGTVTPIIDSAHTLNNAVGSPFGGIFGSTESLEGIHSGTKLTYEDEYVMGLEHEFSHGVILTARYMHRSLRRIVEDTGGIAPEAANAGIGQQFSITNPKKSLDIFTNPQEFDFTGNTVPDPSSPTGRSFMAGVLPAGCVPSADAGKPLIPSGDITFNFPTNSFGAPITDPQGHNGACFSATGLGVNGQPEGSLSPDGIPDGFADPVHKYWAMVFEVNKSFSHNWQLRANYTISKVFGNFEGAFRNDNGQSDPGISSLFDFTEGNFNQLGGQTTPGILNQDRQQVANGYFSYVFDHGKLKNLTLGTGVSVATGTPITELASHPVYLDSGEIPIGGRGALGRTPTTGTVNFHTDYVWSMTERFHLRFGADLFNVANTKRINFIGSNVDLKFGVPNADFLKPSTVGDTLFVSSLPSGIQAPFNARLFMRLEF
jgi:Carboxypeptidase regulatory-like domain/TonB-dependent Receptor Plug Domain